MTVEDRLPSPQLSDWKLPIIIQLNGKEQGCMTSYKCVGMECHGREDGEGEQ